MRLSIVAASLIVGLTTSVEPSFAQTELKNDSFVDGKLAGFQGGFVAGEEGAARLVPPAGSFLVSKVTLLFGGNASPSTQTVTLKIYDDSAGTATPGAVLFASDFQLQGANDAFSEIDISGDTVLVSGPFRVSIAFQHAGFPALARDADPNFDANLSWIFAGTWVTASTLGVLGNWVIRATINGTGTGADAGPGGDAGPTADGGTGTGDACVLNSDCNNGQYCSDTDVCTLDCRVDLDCTGDDECNSIGQCVPADSGGCGCESSGSGGPGALVLFLALMFAFRRRSQ